MPADYPTADEVHAKLLTADGTIFPVGNPNVAYEKFFTGRTFLAPLTSGQSVGVANVTFAPTSRGERSG